MADELLASLKSRFPHPWEFTVDRWKHRLLMRRLDNVHGFVPSKRQRSPREALSVLETAFEAFGIARTALLPVRWQRDTELTVSAVQALDPYLRGGRPLTLRAGYLPQPVVRFTGERDDCGGLREGYLTSFVNVSSILPVASVNQHVELLDIWFTVLSRLGCHARHLELHGALDVWSRTVVRGITLHIQHAGIAIGDASLLWNADKPNRLASDIGSGLERLRWSLSRQAWTQVVFGELAHWHDLTVLDAVRTATLLVGNDIRPGSQGPSGLLRCSLRPIAPGMAAAGLGRLVRNAHAYWSLVGPLSQPWSHISQILEEEVVRSSAHRGEHVTRAFNSGAGQWPPARQ